MSPADDGWLVILESSLEKHKKQPGKHITNVFVFFFMFLSNLKASTFYVHVLPKTLKSDQEMLFDSNIDF